MVASGGSPGGRGPGGSPGAGTRAQEALRTSAAGLLAEGKVEAVIGYGLSPAGDVVPRFVRRSQDAAGLLWNDRCTYNLVGYLTDRDLLAGLAGPEGAAGADTAQSPRFAVTVKGCDLKSLVVLLAESQVRREALTVIGLPCGGVVDQEGRLLGKCVACPEEVRNLRTEPGESPANGPPAGEPAAARRLVDLVMGDPVPGDRIAASAPLQAEPFQDVAEIEGMPRAGRRAFWDAHFSRCLRCYACRNVCPLCYCKECVFDQHNPRWVSPAPGIPSNRAFHLIRAYHLAGRCVDCGECERACPVGIPLRLINRKVAQVVKESFGFEAGTSPEARAPIVDFASGDPEEFIE